MTPLIAVKPNTKIRSMLVPSKVRHPATRTPGTTPCNQTACEACPFIGTNTNTNTNVTGPKSHINITKQFNCLTYNNAYVIHCTRCTQLYFGETGRILDTRFREHLADI